MSRRDQTHPPVEPMPAVLPLIVIESLPSGLLVATVNGDRLAGTPFQREVLGATITELVRLLGVPTRVEVHQPDGTVHADIIRPEPPRSVFAPPPEPLRAPPPLPQLRAFDAFGFVPGEDVALAVILTHSSAGPDGRARALLDPNASLDAVAEVVLIGRISGTTSVQRID